MPACMRLPEAEMEIETEPETETGAEAPVSMRAEAVARQRCLMISSANSLHFTSVAPSIRRAKS
jgi:hypothetical protein